MLKLVVVHSVEDAPAVLNLHLGVALHLGILDTPDISWR
jgi:uncharacterized Rmd1/YagE family protein